MATISTWKTAESVQKTSGQQQLLVEASAWGGFCLKIFFLRPDEPSAQRLGVSRICKMNLRSLVWYSMDYQ